LKKGDRMEFAKIAKLLNLEIDTSFYMISYVVGLCARFINGDIAFQSDIEENNEKKIDELAQKAAKKMLETFIKDLSNIDSNMLKKRGYAYRRAFGNATTIARKSLISRIGVAATDILHGKWINFEDFNIDDDEESNIPLQDANTKIVNTIWATANSFVESSIINDDNEWCKQVGIELGINKNGTDVFDSDNLINKTKMATNLFHATSKRRPVICQITQTHFNYLDNYENVVKVDMVEMIPIISEIANRYESEINNIIFQQRKIEHDQHPEIGISENSIENLLTAPIISENDKQILLKFRQHWFEAIGIQMVRRRDIEYNNYLNRLKTNRMGMISPSKIDKKQIISDAAAKINISGVL